MELIRRNTPEYFAAEEEIDLSDYLDREIELYYVLVTNYEGENETYIEASVENSSSILYDKEIRNKPRTRRTKRNV